MHHLIRSSSSAFVRGFLPVVLFATIGMALCLFVAACEPSDPLEAIRQEMAAGRVQETLEPLRKLLAERPGDAEVLFIYGRALSASGQSGMAEWSLREAMTDPEWLVPAGLQLATEASRAANYDLAITAAGEILEVEPENVQALLVRASAYAHSRMHYEEALVDSERVLELEPENMQILEAKILSLLGLERLDEVAEALDELGTKIDERGMGEGTTAWHCATAAIFASDIDDLELAERRWTNCLEAHPSDPEVVGKALLFFDKQQRFDRSTEILRNAIDDNPNARQYRVKLAASLRAQGDADQAEALLREATEVELPRIASAAWLDLAKHFQEVEKYSAAAEAVGRAVKIVEQVKDPEPSLMLEYADSLLIAGQYAQATEIADKLTYAPYQEVVRARIAQEQRDYELAIEHFEKAFLLWPDNPFARYYAALAAEALGDFDLAVEQFRYSIRIAPNATEARTLVATLHLAEGRPREAIQLLRVKTEESPLEPEGELLSLELWALVGRGGEINRSIEKIRANTPSDIGAALARVAKGLRDRAGPAVAVKSLREAGAIDLADVNYADALRALVEYSHEAGHGEEIVADLEAALAANPDAASLREVAAFHLELIGASDEAVRTAYNLVLEVEPENVRALCGLGRLVASKDPEKALSYFDRAVAASPTDFRAKLAAARSLVDLGNRDEAEKRLNALLDERQFDSGAAGLLAELHLERSFSGARTLDLAKRAVRFGGGADALDLLARVHRGRNEPVMSEEAARRARAYRERENEAHQARSDEKANG